jgi:predicted AAA+ superfamily ATPase
MNFPEKTSIYIDLLDPTIDERLSKNPEILKSMIMAESGKKWVIIDEIQKIPKLLDVVHQLSTDKSIKFALTGSSARKLKRGNANLLAGRAFNYVCYPLSYKELKKQFKIDEFLKFGSLPEIFSLSIEDKKDYLRSYVDTYFKEEIVAEQIVRKLKPFKSFLNVAAQMNGKILNIQKIANDVGVDHSTVQNYFEILEDTLIGFLLEPFHQSIRKRQRQAAKFYYFDVGVTRALQRTIDNSLVPATYEYGNVFEHFIILEIKKLADYKKPDWTFSYLITKDGIEIDLIIERPGLSTIAIEIKSTTNIEKLSQPSLKSFEKLANDINNCEIYLLSQDPIKQKKGTISCLPWQDAISKFGL